MTSSIRKFGIITATSAIAIVAGIAIVHPIGMAFSQQMPVRDHAMPGDHQMPGMMQHMMQMHSQNEMPMGMNAPAMPGQDAFGAIQEIVGILEADPKTDWSKINLEALRQHLIDMNEVTLRASAAATSIDGGLAITIIGEGRTLAAIQRMIPEHAQELNEMNGWQAKAEIVSDGVRLTVTSRDDKEAAHIRGLGFIGLLVSGSHHQLHHLAMAKNELVHQH